MSDRSLSGCTYLEMVHVRCQVIDNSLLDASGSTSRHGSSRTTPSFDLMNCIIVISRRFGGSSSRQMRYPSLVMQFGSWNGEPGDKKVVRPMTHSEVAYLALSAECCGRLPSNAMRLHPSFFCLMVYSIFFHPHACPHRSPLH